VPGKATTQASDRDTTPPRNRGPSPMRRLGLLAGLTLAVLAGVAVIGASVTPRDAGHVRVYDDHGLAAPTSPSHLQGAYLHRTMAIMTGR
jgi:hypothetical protein